ncbi:hypothetical protein IV203_027080 [Nitzschia inconspicua]|uniref:Uncharacterized protein n=1 Tax=Nitzschia inconspicua TaxID=303405 RepID=A0A9K3Q0K2_9STRA|nr:hypothetical protein IV203_027080 [Nitzschia inconspicua]
MVGVQSVAVFASCHGNPEKLSRLSGSEIIRGMGSLLSNQKHYWYSIKDEKDHFASTTGNASLVGAHPVDALMRLATIAYDREDVASHAMELAFVRGILMVAL